MKKSDLRFGNVVELRSGKLCLITPIMTYEDKQCFYVYNETQFIDIKSGAFYGTFNKYTEENLVDKEGLKEFDIMKVYEDYTLKNLLWERKEIKLSEQEIEVLKALKTLGYKAIVRNKNDPFVTVYGNEKLIKGEKYWFEDLSISFRYDLIAFRNVFQFVKWEDEKPYSIDELLESVKE